METHEKYFSASNRRKRVCFSLQNCGLGSQCVVTDNKCVWAPGVRQCRRLDERKLAVLSRALGVLDETNWSAACLLGQDAWKCLRTTRCVKATCDACHIERLAGQPADTGAVSQFCVYADGIGGYPAAGLVTCTRCDSACVLSRCLGACLLAVKPWQSWQRPVDAGRVWGRKPLCWSSVESTYTVDARALNNTALLNCFACGGS